MSGDRARKLRDRARGAFRTRFTCACCPGKEFRGHKALNAHHLSRHGSYWAGAKAKGMGRKMGKQADAICVLVIRPHDSVFWVDPRCKPEDAEKLVKDYVPRLAERVEQSRREKKPAARLELGPNGE